MTGPTIPTTHTTVVGIPTPDDAESIARAAAHAALSLLTKVAAEQRGSVSIQSVTITTPEHVRPGPGLAALLNGGGDEKAVVVTARVDTPAATEEAP